MNRFKKRSSRPPRESRGPRGPRVDNNIKAFVVFFCKDCEKLVEAKPVGRKFAYKCNVCGTKNVAFGTEEAMRNFYRVKEDKSGDDKAKKGEEKVT